MQDIGCKLSRTAAVVVMLLVACVGSAWGQYKGGVPWQVGDIIVCFGSGTCNVLRIVNGSPVLLDQFSDGLLGQTSGVALNNSLHAVVTDNAGGGASNVVVYSIASLNPNTNPATPVAHTAVPPSPFTAGGNNAQALAVNKAGHMFVGNAGSGGTPTPSIAELNPDGTVANPSALPTNPFPLPAGCTDTQGTVLNMDLSADGSALYLTSGGPTIQKLTLAGGTCAPFANFGGNVKLYGIKDIPAGALGNVSPSCKGSACPAGEALLVVAIGNTDPDSSESGETGPDADAVNICTNTTGGSPVSCALLLDTNPNPGLTASLWQATSQYFTLGAAILDPQLHLQTVLTAGTSGGQEPNFSETGGTVMDNAVIWTDKGQPGWAANTQFTQTPFPGTYIVDSNSNLQTVTTTGTSGPTVPAWNTSGNTTDGLVWSDQGAWQANHTFLPGSAVGDASGHPHTVLTAGTSGAALPTWNDGGGVTIDNAVTWTNQGPVVGYTGNHQYALNTYTEPNGHIQQAVEPGTSGGSTPAFSTSGGRTIDNAVTWADLGPAAWLPSFNYGLNAIIVDGNGNVQQVITAGTSGPGPQPPFTSSPTTDGLQWQNSGTVCGSSCTSPWMAGTQYAAGSAIDDNSGFIWNAISGGTSGTSANRPAFEGNETPDLVLVDNAVVWASQGPKSGFAWAANHPYSVNTQIVDGNNHVQLVSVAGTSGPNAPAFQDGSTASDNSVTWTNLGFAVWRPTFSYGLNAIIVDPAGHVQQVTTPGTTGASQPTFNDSGATTSDSAVTWTDRGALAGNVTFTWQVGTAYALNAMIVDAGNQIELATTAGTSGGSMPAFADGGNALDGLVWLDLGPTVPWSASTSFPLGTLTVDTGIFLQKATTAGISTTPGPPAWNETPTGMTVDGLQWTDQGHLVWAAHQLYGTLGALISDPSAHAQKVIEAGTAGATIPGFSMVGGQTIDNAVIWTESHPLWLLNHPYVVGNSDTLILDPTDHVQLVSTSGTSGPTTPPFTSNKPAAGQTIDGLQWTNQANPATSVVARYPVNGTTTLQVLSLDPLITDCTGNNCSSAVPPAKTSNFWLADSQHFYFYKLDFATGTPTQFNANGTKTATTSTPCSTCTQVSGIQGIAIYGGEGSNQPGLTKVLSGAAGSANNQIAFFPLPTDPNNTNALTLTLYNGTSVAPSLPAFAVYGSSVPQPVGQPSCFFDGTGTPSLPCTVTTATGNAIVWKNDIPLPVGANPPLRLDPVTQTLAYSFDVPLAFQSANNNVFVDSSYNTTTGVGKDYPSGRYPSSTGIGTPVNAGGNPPQDFGCTYQTPAPKCFQNPGTIPVKFVCSSLPGISLQNFASGIPYGPRLQIVSPATAPPAQFCTGAAPSEANATKLSGGHAPNVGICPTQLLSSNGKTTYRFDSSALDWVFNWSVPSTKTKQTYHICTYDDSHNAQTFCLDITVASSCSAP